MNFNKCVYLGNHHRSQGREHFLSPQKVPSCSFEINSLIPTSRQLLTCFMSVPILEFSKFGLLQYDSCVWLLLFSIRCLRFTQVVACISSLFFLILFGFLYY